MFFPFFRSKNKTQKISIMVMECNICIEETKKPCERVAEMELCPEFKRRRGLKDFLMICPSCKYTIIKMLHMEGGLVARLKLNRLFRQLQDFPPPNPCPFRPGPRVSEGEEPLFF